MLNLETITPLNLNRYTEFNSNSIKNQIKSNHKSRKGEGGLQRGERKYRLLCVFFFPLPPCVLPCQINLATSIAEVRTGAKLPTAYAVEKKKRSKSMTVEQEKKLFNRYVMQRAEAIKTGDAEALAMYEYMDKVNYRLARKNRPLMIPIIEQMFDDIPRVFRMRGIQDAE